MILAAASMSARWEKAFGPPDDPCGQAAVGALVLFNPCHARASELSRCPLRAPVGFQDLPRIPYNPRSGQGSYWCARGDLNRAQTTLIMPESAG
jgi:hypothetical protein